jgi:hypothetical protein
MNEYIYIYIYHIAYKNLSFYTLMEGRHHKFSKQNSESLPHTHIVFKGSYGPHNKRPLPLMQHSSSGPSNGYRLFLDRRTTLKFAHNVH